MEPLNHGVAVRDSGSTYPDFINWVLPYDLTIYHPGPVFHHLGRQRRQRKSKTPKTLLNQAPPTVAGLFSCPGAIPAPGLFLVPPGGAGPPGMIPAADRDRPGGSWRQNDRPPGRGRRSKFCGGQIFPAVKILPCGQNIVGSGIKFFLHDLIHNDIGVLLLQLLRRDILSQGLAGGQGHFLLIGVPEVVLPQEDA